MPVAGKFKQSESILPSPVSISPRGIRKELTENEEQNDGRSVGVVTREEIRERESLQGLHASSG